MKTVFILTLTLLMSGKFLFAQEAPIVIKATSKHIRILDGDDLREGELVPELKPDIYVYHRSTKPKRIAYYTNIDSVSFEVKPGDTYNFAIVWNNTDTCYQKLT